MKIKGLLFLLVIGLSLLSFKSGKVNLKYSYPTDLLGHWRITNLYINDLEVDIGKYPKCEDKENIEFKDSTAKWETYIFRKERCFKDTWSGKYKFFYEYDSEQKKMVNKLQAGRQFSFVIMELNDSILKLKEPHHNLLKCFKKIKSL